MRTNTVEMSMVNPSTDTLMKKVDSRYGLVVLAAKRARQLLDGAELKATKARSTKNVTNALEEIAEVMSKLALNHLDAPCIFYNLNGYYDHMKALLDHMIEMELSTKERQKKIYFADTLEEVTALLN